MTVRVAAGQTPVTATLEEAVPAAVAAVAEARADGLMARRFAPGRNRPEVPV